MRWIVVICLGLIAIGWCIVVAAPTEPRQDGVRKPGAVSTASSRSVGDSGSHKPLENQPRRTWGTPHPALVAALFVMISLMALIVYEDE